MECTLKKGDETVHLREDGVWESSNEGLAMRLNARFRPELYPPSPANGRSVMGEMINAAAKHCDAEIIWPDNNYPETPGRVY